MLNNIAVSYYNRGDRAKAKAYLLRSLEVMPQAHTYYSLAQIYSDEGRHAEAAELWNRALDAKELYLRERITRIYAAWLKENGDYRRSAAMASVADSLKTELDRGRNMAEKILILENNYEREELSARQTWRIVWIVGLSVFVLALVGAAWSTMCASGAATVSCRPR